MAKKDTDWPSPPSAATLREIEQYLCRCRNRPSMFGGVNPDVLQGGHSGMLGRVLDATTARLKTLKVPHPSQELLGTLSSTPLAKSTIQKYLQGTLSRNAKIDWPDYANHAIRTVMLGRTPSSDAEAVKIWDRVNQYFFRPSTSEQGVPAFFERFRRPYPDPCSRTELAGEINWFVREATRPENTNRSVGRFRLVWACGREAAFPDGVSKDVGAAVAEAIRGGGDVTFVYSVPKYGPTVGSDLDVFAAHYSVTDKFRRVDIPGNEGGKGGGNKRTPGQPEGPDFLNQCFQFLFLSVPTSLNTSGSEEILYILRGGEPIDIRRQQYGPIAWTANEGEAAEFKKWMDRFVPKTER